MATGLLIRDKAEKPYPLKVKLRNYNKLNINVIINHQLYHASAMEIRRDVKIEILLPGGHYIFINHYRKYPAG